MAEEFPGFANAPVDKKGKVKDFRDVKPFVDESDEGKVRTQSQTTESSIVQFRTEGPGTNGAPAAVVGKDYSSSSDAPEADPAEGEGANGA